MTTIEFYQHAVEAAKTFGYENPSIVTTSGCYEGIIHHTCQLWDSSKKEFISSGLHGNPVAVIQAFKDALEFNQKSYADYKQDIEI